MKLDLAKAVYEAQWFDFGPGTRLKIRPYPATLSNMAFRDGAIVIAGASSFDMFQHCLVDWEGVNDADDKPLKLTPEVKKKVFDFRLGQQEIDGNTLSISDFVLRKAREISDSIEADEKN